MLKNIIVLLIISLIVIVGAHHLRPLIMALLAAHDWISQALLQVFSGGKIASIIRQLIALISIPLFIGLIPTLVYWLAKRRLSPYFMHIVWAVWLIQTSALIILYHANS
jgi:hypothetical protein